MKDRFDRIIDLCERNKKVLDVGCVGYPLIPMNSEKSLHSRLKKISKKVIGLDVVEKPYGKPDIVCDIEKFRSREKYDVIVASDIIEHVSNPGLMLESIKRCLRPDGTVIITTPNACSFLFAIEGIILNEKRFSKEHSLIFSPKSLSSLMKRYGFEITHFELCNTSNNLNIIGMFSALFSRLIGKEECIVIVAKIEKKAKDYDTIIKEREW